MRNSGVEQNPLSTSPKWHVVEHDRQVHRLVFENVTSGSEGWILLQTDEHWDNQECNRVMLKQHHEEAVAKNAPILKFGDVFCAMQGKWDRRADQNQLRPEHRGNCYLDRLVDTAAEWYAPYAKNIALLTPGNHETSIVNHHQTDLTERLAERLRQQPGSAVHVGGYWGYVRLQFEIADRVASTKVLHYHHGYGGGGEVTRGFIDNNRTRGQYDGDIFVSGHIHRRNMDENIMTRLKGNKIVRQEQIFLRGATYKQEFNGWHAERGRSARPCGAWWLRYRCKYVTKDGSGSPEIEICEVRAT